MRPLIAFALGFYCGKKATDIAGALALSDTALGKELRGRILAGRPYEHLLRTETEVAEEINRRVRAA